MSTDWYIIGGAVVVIAFFAVQWYYNQSTPKTVDRAPELGRVIRQYKQDGDAVVVGDQLLEIDFNRVNVVIESEYAGTIEWLVVVGQQTEIGSTFANISDGVNDNAVVFSEAYIAHLSRS